jgi:hypothetical protein
MAPTASSSSYPMGPTARPSSYPMGPTARPASYTMGPTARPASYPMGPTARPASYPMGPTARPASYPMGPIECVQEASIPTGRAAGHLHLLLNTGIRGAIPLLPHTSPWHVIITHRNLTRASPIYTRTRENYSGAELYVKIHEINRK